MDEKKFRFATEGNLKLLMQLIKQKLGDYLTDDEISSAIEEAIADVAHVRFEKVESLPETGQTNVIYLVQNNSSEEDNVYDEYFWSASDLKFEKFGTTQIDLSGYLTKDDFEPISDAEINTLWDSVMNPEDVSGE